MKRSSRLSVALHVLVHLAKQPGEPMTSEDLATCLTTNAVVVRRTLAGLRKVGLVTSTAGHGGGWLLAREPKAITLEDVQKALGERLLFAVDVAGPNPHCVIASAVTGALDDFLEEAEALLAARLRRITLADLTARIHHTPHGRGAHRPAHGGASHGK